MRVSRILLRWYRSFNTRYHGYRESPNEQPAPWDSFRSQSFPFVEIPVDRQVTTVVGANESGKSHLLSAISKVFTGKGVGDEADLEYAVQDICRYCAFEGLDQDIWPNIGVEFTFEDHQEYSGFLKAVGLAVPTAEGEESAAPKRCTVILGGSQAEAQFAQVHFPSSTVPSSAVSKSKWKEACEKTLPALKFINAKVPLSNELHVQQLLALYGGKTPGFVYDPLFLQNLAEQVTSLKLEAGKAPDGPVLQAFQALCSNLAGHKVGIRSTGELETLLFRDVLEIREDILERMASLGQSDRGYVERLVAEINHRIDERLDLTHFWQQDDQFRLTVDYKSGFFFFEITDRTGAKYTFNERSSGLRFFLSYYIQAKAIEKANEKRGSIVLMDEPDSFLSIAGQRNLLQVFESLVSPKTSAESCQLIYTTHSPFLINRNFPKRLCLVRKGDGSEGTQYVPRSAIRRYEPVRSALGVDCAETLFMGATNIVVEGISDQRILIAAIQKFGDPSDVERYLDLNAVTFVSAGGASHVCRLVEKSIAGDEKRPIVVVLLDGDIPGNNAYQKLTADGLLDKAFVTTIDQCGITPTWNQNPKVMEDLIPPSLLAFATRRYLKERWKQDADLPPLTSGIAGGSPASDNAAERLVKTVRTALGADANGIGDDELKGQVLDTFAECLVDDESFDGNRDVEAFGENVRLVCTKLQSMIDEAERRYARDSLQKCVRLTVNAFSKAHHRGATRADLERCLNQLDRECAGVTPEARDARENLNQFRDLVQQEVANPREKIEMTKWHERLDKFQQCPWKKIEVDGN